MILFPERDSGQSRSPDKLIQAIRLLVSITIRLQPWISTKSVLSVCYGNRTRPIEFLLESTRDRSGQIAGSPRRIRRTRRACAHAGRQGASAARQIAGGYRLSREAHDFLFSAGDIDTRERGAVADLVSRGKNQALSAETSFLQMNADATDYEPGLLFPSFNLGGS